ncbi:MAG: HEAT repeat domain-containing protein [Solirubrobacteraceae bacterium MAG38_C4-C5]|nr:HEAT repeat domain-containing protein [Candidatus Siliceabacter maunaloa]
MVMHDTLRDLLTLSRSPSWERRCRAAAGLADFESSDAAAAMRDLLRDQEDTAVVQEAARALLHRQDSYGADLIFEAVATAEDEIADHILYFIGRQRRSLELSGFRDLAESSLVVGEDRVREGAAELLEYLGWTPPH